MRLKGYRLLAQRFKSPQGEIDLIMRRRDVTAFIEVKARSSRDHGVEAVTTTQSKRICGGGALLDGARQDIQPEFLPF